MDGNCFEGFHIWPQTKIWDRKKTLIPPVLLLFTHLLLRDRKCRALTEVSQTRSSAQTWQFLHPQWLSRGSDCKSQNWGLDDCPSRLPYHFQQRPQWSTPASTQTRRILAAPSEGVGYSTASNVQCSPLDWVWRRTEGRQLSSPLPCVASTASTWSSFLSGPPCLATEWRRLMGRDWRWLEFWI